MIFFQSSRHFYFPTGSSLLITIEPRISVLLVAFCVSRKGPLAWFDGVTVGLPPFPVRIEVEPRDPCLLSPLSPFLLQIASLLK